jgi:hypothetical protein
MPAPRDKPAPAFYFMTDLVPHRLIPCSVPTLYGWIAKGLFPAPQKLPNGWNVWPRERVHEWKDSLPSGMGPSPNPKAKKVRKPKKRDARAPSRRSLRVADKEERAE